MSFHRHIFGFRRLGLGVTALCVAASGWSQSGVAPALSLPDALQKAASANPALHAERFRQNAAAALVEQADLRPNPTLDISVENAIGTGPFRGIDAFEATVQASQLIERGDKRARRVSLAESQHDLTINAFAVRRAEVLAATAEAFVAVLAAQERVALVREPLALAATTIESVQARVDAAVASPAESARARAALAMAQAEAARADAALVRARSTLASTWGGAATDVAHLNGKLHVPDALPDPTVYRARLAEHPRKLLAAAAVERDRAALALEQAHATQDITVGGGLRFFRSGSDAALVAGVSLPLPVRNRNQGNIRAARETLAGVELAADAVAIELRTAFDLAWQDLALAHQQVIAIRRDALPPTTAAHAIVREAYDSGQLPLLDVLDAQRALIALRRELLDASADYAIALARVESLTDPSFTSLSTLLAQP